MSCNECGWKQLQINSGRFVMVSVGIDVSKGKSTVCLMRPFGEIVAGPMEITHVDSELKTLVKRKRKV